MRVRTTTRGAWRRVGARYREHAALTFFFPSSSPISAIAVPSLPLHLLPCLCRAQPVTAPPLPFPLRRRESDDRRPIPLPFSVPPSSHQDRAPPSLFSSSSPIRPREFDTTETSLALPLRCALSPSPLPTVNATAASVLPSLLPFSFRPPPASSSSSSPSSPSSTIVALLSGEAITLASIASTPLPCSPSLLFFPPRRLRRRPPIIAPPLPHFTRHRRDRRRPLPHPLSPSFPRPPPLPTSISPSAVSLSPLRLLHRLQTATTSLLPLRPPSSAAAVTDLPAGHGNFSPPSLLSRWVGDGFGKRRRVGCGLSHNGLDWVRWAL